MALVLYGWDFYHAKELKTTTLQAQASSLITLNVINQQSVSTPHSLASASALSQTPPTLQKIGAMHAPEEGQRGKPPCFGR